MNIKKSYPNIIEQKTGTYKNNKQYASFNNLNNIKNDDGTYATAEVDSENGTYNKPAYLTLSDFNFDVPDDAVIERITVGYAHYKINTGQGYPLLSAPKIIVKGVGSTLEQMGKSVDYTSEKVITSFEIPSILDVGPEQINNSLSVEIEYPVNQGEAGKINLEYVFVEVTFSSDNYVISCESSVGSKKIHKGEEFELGIVLGNMAKGKGNYVSDVEILIPPGVEFLSGEGVIRKDGNKLNWTAIFYSSWKDRTTLKFKATTSGEKTFRMYNSLHGEELYSTSIIIPVLQSSVTIEDDLPKYEIENNTFRHEIVSTYDSDLSVERVCRIIYPVSFNISNLSSTNDAIISQSSDSEGNTIVTWSVPAGVKQAYFQADIQVVSPDIHLVRIVDEDGAELSSKTIKITPKSYTTPFLAKYKLPPAVIDRMEGGVMYRVTTYMKLELTSENQEYFNPYQWNYRFHLFNEDGVEITDYNLLYNAISTKPIEKIGEWVKMEIYFNYYDKAPVYLIWTGEYKEQQITLFNVHFTNPIIEEALYQNKYGIEQFGNYPSLVKSLISPLKNSVTNIKPRGSSNSCRLSDLNFGGLTKNENFVLQGIEISADVVSDSDCAILFEVRTPANLVGQKSISVMKGADTYTVGGAFDLFGLKYGDLKEIERTNFDIKIINPYDHSVRVEVGNIHVKFYYTFLNTNEWDLFYIDGISSEYYECFLHTLKIKGGTENKVEYFSAEGNDTTIASRMNIEPKEIEMEFDIATQNLELSTLIFKNVAKWFANERDRFNRPIPKKIEFAHLPDEVFWYIMEEPLDEDLQIGWYNIKAKLKIPSGVSESKEYIYTNNVGSVRGLVRVNPIIQVLALNSEISITEHISNQTFIVRDNSIKNGDLVVIDTAKRICKLLVKKRDGTYLEKDITNNVDFDSDWFSLKGDYFFKTNESCIVQTIKYKEKIL